MKPILFNTEMVKAILDGRKTQTRRVVKPQSILQCDGPYIFDNGNQVLYCKGCGDWVAKADGRTAFAPPYTPGEILWVRETWCEYCADHVIDRKRFAYKADATPISEEARVELGYKWKPSIHMPKEAARIFLLVTDVRVERLQDITEAGARAEGCCAYKDKIGDGKFDDVICFDLTAKDAFTELWNSTIKPADLPKYSWDANPWVWVIEFERIEKPD